METQPAPTVAPETVSLHAKSPFEMRVHLGDGSVDAPTRAHLPPVENEALHDGRQVHISPNSVFSEITLRLDPWVVKARERGVLFCRRPYPALFDRSVAAPLVVELGHSTLEAAEERLRVEPLPRRALDQVLGIELSAAR